MNLKGKLSYAGPMGPTGPAGKDAIATVDNSTIITNSAGALETSVGGGWVDGLVKDKEIVNNINSPYADVSSIITEDIFNEMVSYGDKLRADVCSSRYGISKGCLCNVSSSKIEITPYEENDRLKVVYKAEHINGKWRCRRGAMTDSGSVDLHFTGKGNSFYSVKNGKTIANLKGQFLPIDNNTIVLNSKAQLTNGAIFNSPFYSRLCLGAELQNVEKKAQNCIKISVPTNMYGDTTVQGEHLTAIGMSAMGSGNIGIGCSLSGTVGGNDSILINAGQQPTQNYNSNCIGIGSSLSFTNDYQTIIGSSNVDTYASFVVAIGRYGNQFNALTIDNSGNATFAGTVSPSGADYAEYFEDRKSVV